MSFKFALLIFVITFYLQGRVYSQIDTTGIFSANVKVIAGKEYERSGLTEIFLGEHWRKLWTTPFKAGVLDLNKFAGGLTPYKKGGGLQTKSLRFKGNDGKKYKFRSINKDPRRILPPDLQESIFADMFKDQISTSNPFSALIVSPLLNRVGILNAEPIVTVLPDDVKLGEFKNEFGSLLGTFEENPDDGSDGEKGFGKSDKIINSFKLYEKTERDNDQRIDKIEFLKARLIDMMIGDWDRHSDQWLWAGYKQDGITIYKPIPRDRDQAFSLYDGLFPMIAGEAVTQIEGYGKDYPKIYDLTFNGRYLDRMILPEVEKKVYDSLTKFIQISLTDSVIRSAVHKMPYEMYGLEGNKLETMILSRRNKLKEASDDFYNLINETADIYGSNKDEYLELKVLNDNSLQVKLFDINRKKSEVESLPFFEKVFNSGSTDEIRIYLNNGNDSIGIIQSRNAMKLNEKLSGTGIDVKIIKAKGKILSDEKSSLEILKDERPLNEVEERYEPLNEDRGYDWRFGPVFNFNSDNGLTLGGGPILYKYGLNVKPYSYRQTLLGSYSFGSKSYSFQYLGEFYGIIKNAQLKLDIRKTELEITKFFGEGNETPFNSELDSKDFYKVGQELLYISPSIKLHLSEKLSLELLPFYKFSDVMYDQNTFLSENPLTYGIGNIKYMGVNANFTFDSRDNDAEAYKGIYASILGNFTPEVIDNVSSFGKAGFDFRGYISTGGMKGITLALQTAGGKIWGDYPFYESMFLGGENSLKGFSRERFAGDGVIVGQAELRIRLFKVNILIPGMLGISFFGGSGRVFLEGEESKRWHSSFGSSVWITYLNRMFNIGFTAAKSDEGYKYFIGAALFL
ncbi:MAG: hypothetical protein HGGPFJEG_01787 [Ignavibacteria bacterium]|nr:hypothetical protein [Ignavibacteria bacterium]